MRSISIILAACLGGAAFGLGSTEPETYKSALLSLLGLGGFLTLVQLGIFKRWAGILFGLAFHASAFYWLPQTLERFGGFPPALANLIFAAFCVLSSLQFLFFVALVRRLEFVPSSDLSKAGGFFGLFFLALGASSVWLLLDYVFPKLFPWRFIYTQVVWPGLPSWAGIVGPFILEWLVVASLLLLGLSIRVGLARGGRGINSLTACPVIFVVLLVLVGLGFQESALERMKLSRKLKVGLIQGNLSTEEKGDSTLLTANLETYRKLSLEAVEEGAELIVWPETVFTKWLPLSQLDSHKLDSIKSGGEEGFSYRGPNYDPAPELDVPLLFGGLTYARRSPESYTKITSKLSDSNPQSLGLRRRFRNHQYNSAILKSSDGAIQGYYHKKTLMPFGEYLPFGESFPSLYSLSPHTGNFSAGELSGSLPLELGNEESSQGSSVNSSVKLGVSICYEDMLVSQARKQAREIGEAPGLLVNLTNDAWYGDTAAPHQHHLLAQWRAIETGRAMIRATNTGLSGIVDPLGRTVAKLSTFSEESGVFEVPLMSHVTVYTRFGGLIELFWLILVSLGGFLQLRRLGNN